jgi:zinc transporter ZupT
MLRILGEDDDHHEDDLDHLDDLDEHKKFNIKGFKVGMLFAIWLCCMAGILPKLVPAINKNGTVLSFMNCFSAGIFLGMALIHIIPESVEVWHEYGEKKKIERPFPLPFVLIYVGYLIVLSVDRVIAGFLLKLTGKEKEAHLAHGHGGEGHDHDHDHKHDQDHEHNHEQKHDTAHKHDHDHHHEPHLEDHVHHAQTLKGEAH